MYILVDTNVFIDLILNRGKDAEIADLFFKNVYSEKSKIFISPMSLRDIEYTVVRLTHNKKAGKDAMFIAYEMCHKMIVFSRSDAIEALTSEVDDYEDALLVEAAKRELLNVIVTNNIKDFKKADIPVWTPAYFNEVVKNEKATQRKE